MDALAKTLSAIREAWEPKTTARNLQLSEQRPDLPGDATNLTDEGGRHLN